MVLVWARPGSLHEQYYGFYFHIPIHLLSQPLQLGGRLKTSYVAVTGTYAILETDCTVDCTANTFTITLPTAVGVEGQIYNLKNSGTGVITLATTSAQTIDGEASATLTLTQYENLQVQSNNV